MAKIYIVQGSSGDYDDHKEWPVAAYLSEEKAHARVKACMDGLRELFARYPDGYYGNNYKAYNDALKELVPDPYCHPVPMSETEYIYYPLDIEDSDG